MRLLKPEQERDLLIQLESASACLGSAVASFQHGYAKEALQAVLNAEESTGRIKGALERMLGRS
jgi:hypothetical protein